MMNEGKWIAPGTHRVTLQLTELLGQEPTDTITDERMEAVTGKSCRAGGAGYPYLRTAQKRCEREYGRVWSRIRGAGCIKRMDTTGTQTLADGSRSHIRRTAKRACGRLACHPLDSMPVAERTKHLALMAQFGTVAQFASASTTKRLEARNITEAIDLPKLLEAIPK